MQRKELQIHILCALLEDIQQSMVVGVSLDGENGEEGELSLGEILWWPWGQE